MWLRNKQMFKRAPELSLPTDRASQRGQVCRVCGSQSLLNIGALGVCGPCIRTDPNQALRIARALHVTTRSRFGLPVLPPRAEGGVRCVLCSRERQMGEAGRGYCGLRTVRDGRMVHLAGTPQRGILEWYRDPLPTNCVAGWVCGGQDRLGYHNLAVFYASCTLNCLFCQPRGPRRDSNPRGRYMQEGRTTRGLLILPGPSARTDHRLG